jgi:hypothetical protein
MALDPNRKTHLGIRPGELDGKWYGKYYNPDMTRLADHAIYALTLGPQAAALHLPLEDVTDLIKPGYQPIETGYVFNPDGSMFVAAQTHFPRATVPMLDWWFWWHARGIPRYKLWHPRAHVYVKTEATEFPAGTPDRECYIGSVSYIDEYVGNTLGQLCMHWLHPTELGFDESDLDPDYPSAVCCRVGLSGAPIEWGYLIHHVRRVEDGVEMRVRLWLGGRHVAARGDAASLTADQGQQLEGMRQVVAGSAHAMLVHCCQEMTHLATFLPALYREGKSRGEA